MSKISILTPCYNHEKYIKDYLQSVLNQTFGDFELIIVDDCSSDRSVEEIEKFHDKRIKLIRHSFNKGINAGLNTAFANSSGEFIVFMASDDVFMPNALEVLYKALSQSEAIVAYPRTLWIDENNKIIKTNHKEAYQDRIELLHHFFMKGNGLTSPGMMIKREFCDFFPLQNSICNQQDTQIHIDLLLRGEPIFIEEPLIKYRRDSKGGNISSISLSTQMRESLEKSSVMDTFLQCKDIELLKKIFKDEIKMLDFEPSSDILEFFMGRMALLSPKKEQQVWGYHKIMHFYSDIKNVEILKEKYSFTFKEYLGLVKEIKQDEIVQKYKKYKKLFNESVALIVVLTIVIIWLGVKNA
ncbi:glycosyltransferase family 2 protein [Helicobacter burdigaliensis]|uniref:glycosyltransferase family 2 protein n=1 Tax=Helicobacter burdigaliensis TaxID=2315334 RepID=UPI000EF73774|nr:glycosyltransferase family 2 protein [Helicobacter burdigaliensis]